MKLRESETPASSPLRRPESKKKKEEISQEDLHELLRDKRITLSCGHHYQLHPFSNTMVITCDGKTFCHN